MLTRDLSGIDGIVVVGGDGTFANIAQGLLERAQRDAGLELREREEEIDKNGEKDDNSVHNPADDLADKNGDGLVRGISLIASSPTSSAATNFFNLRKANFVSNTVPIAHIPGGSGNAHSATTSGVHDAASTAVLIALGKIVYTDVTAVAELDPSKVMVRTTN